MKRLILAIGTTLVVAAAHAATPDGLLQGYASQAKQETPGFQSFSAARGEQFYHAKRTHGSGKVVSCASCHGSNPRSAGRNEKTGKEILPLAPTANPERLTDSAKVEKWFRRNCQDVLERACTAQEKGDFLAYLLSLK